MSRRSYTRRQVCQLGLSGLAGLSLLDLAACGGSGSPSASKTETMQLSFWGDVSRNKLTRNAIKLFEQNHSTITITSWFASFTAYFDKLNTQISGGNTPDLIQMDMSYVKQYVDQHILLDLTSLISDKTIDLSDFDQDMLSNSEDSKVAYGIPLGGNYECMVYDTNFIQQAGVGTPPAQMSWKDFAAYAAEISKALASQKIVGIADASGAVDLFEIWVRQHGTELYTTDGKIAFSLDDVTSWFSYWSDMRKSGACASAQLQATVTGSGPANALLSRGKAAFSTGHSNEFGGYQVVNQHTLALQMPPTGPGPGLYFKPSMLMSIAASSKYAKDAANFINFLITQPAGVKAIGLDRGVPGSVRARAALQPGLTATDKKVITYVNQITSSNLHTPRTVLDPAGAGKLQLLLTNNSQALSFGKLSLQDAANTFYKQSQQAVAKS